MQKFLVISCLVLSACAGTTNSRSVQRLSYSDLHDISRGYMCYDSTSCIRAAKVLITASEKLTDDEREALFENFSKTVQTSRDKDMEKVKNATAYLAGLELSDHPNYEHPYLETPLTWEARLSHNRARIYNEAQGHFKVLAKDQEDRLYSVLGARGTTELNTLAKTIIGLVELAEFIDDHPQIVVK